jgi:hypothetical protein
VVLVLGWLTLGALTTNGKYLVAMPKDPKCSSANDTGYEIVKDANGRITVDATCAEQGKTISVTR